MSQNGNEDISIVKKDLVGQKLGTTYYTNLEFAHEFVGGETEIDFNSLNLPSVASIEGFTNYLPSRYIEAAITQNRGNVFLHSSSRGQLQRFTEFFIRENNKIRLNYTAEPNEIITGVLNSTIRSTPTILDVKKIDVTGTLAEGTTTFNVGQEYNVNSNPSTQLGELKVYRWQGSEAPKLMLRCVGNNLNNIGNYIEVNNTIEFKEAGRVGGENIVVFSTNTVATQPKEGFSQELQTIGGQVDLISEFLQDVHSLPTNPFQAAANQVDLRAFGQKVINSEIIISSLLELEIVAKQGIGVMQGYVSRNVNEQYLMKTVLVNEPDGLFTLTNTDHTRFTFNEICDFTAAISFNGGIQQYTIRHYDANDVLLANWDNSSQNEGTNISQGRAQVGDYLVYRSSSSGTNDNIFSNFVVRASKKAKISDLI